MRTIKIEDVDYERMEKLSKHIPQWKGKPHTKGQLLSIFIDFIFDCYPDLINENNKELKPIFQSGNQQYINRILWQEYIKRSWGKYII